MIWILASDWSVLLPRHEADVALAEEKQLVQFIRHGLGGRDTGPEVSGESSASSGESLHRAEVEFNVLRITG